MQKLKTNFATHLVQPISVAEFSVKGSGLTPLDSPRYGLRCYVKLLWSVSYTHLTLPTIYSV